MKPKQSQTKDPKTKTTTNILRGRQAVGTESATRGEPRSVELSVPGDRVVWIARRAYQLYEEEGRQDGHALDHWLKAEEEIQGHSHP